MRQRHLRMMFLVFLAAGSAFPAASPAWADAGCSPGTDCTGFVSPYYQVEEAAGYVDLAVGAAWCCPVAQGQIDYETFALSAVAGQDFQQSSGTLTFAGGGGADIRVPIMNDALSEGDERFGVRLTNFRGTFVKRGHETAIVTIFGNDTAPSPESPPATAGPNQSTTGSKTGSSAHPAAPSAIAEASARPAPPLPIAEPSGSADRSNQSVEMQPQDQTPVGGLGAEERRDDSGPPTFLLAGLGVLLLVASAAAGFGLKKGRLSRLRRGRL